MSLKRRRTTRRVRLGPKPSLESGRAYVTGNILGYRMPPPPSFNLSVPGGWSELDELGLICIHGTVDDS
jgi:hypothetical protein